MADNQEEVLYKYTGDVSSLKQATETALSLLDKYQSHISRISADGGFGKSSRAVKSFQAQLNAVTKQFDSVKKQMQGVSDIRLFPSSQVTKTMQEVLSSANQVYSKLSASSKLSTKEVQALTTQLRSSQSTLKNNSAEVTALVQRQQRWMQTLENVRNRTSQLRTTMDTLKGKVSGAFDPMLSKLSAINTPLTALGAKMQSFKDKATDSFSKVGQLANTVASAFRRVSTAESDSANATNKSTSAHSRLRNILSSVQNAFKKETTELATEKNSLKTKNNTLDTSTRKHKTLGTTLSSLGKIIHNENISIKAFNNNLKNLSSISGLVRAGLLGLTSIPISYWLSEAANQSISYTENVNLFNVAMGESVEIGKEFVNQMSEIYGMDPSNLMRYAGNFYQLSDAIRMPDEDAAKLSLSLLKATNDISSLFNVPIDQVFENLSSGMQGMSRAVRKYGMDIRATTLQQTALSLGIRQNVENMSEANRQGLRFITMMQQASNASGDFARTIESPANQLKIFKEQISQLGRAIGDLFIAPLATAIQYINGFVMALRMVISFIGSVLGLVGGITGGSGGITDTTDSIADSIGGVGSAAGGAAKKIKAMLAPFDELNVLQDQASGGGGGGGGGGLSDMDVLDPAIQEAIENMQLGLENIRMKALEVRDSLLAFFGFKVEDGAIVSWDSKEFEKNLINKLPQWTKTIQSIFREWSNIVEAFKHLLESLGGVATAVWEKVTGFIGKFINDDSVSSFIDSLAGAIDALASFIDEHQDSIANMVLILSGLAGAFKALNVIIPIVSAVASAISTIAPSVSSLTPVLGVIAVIAGAIIVLYQASESFAFSFDNLVSSIVEGFIKMFQGLSEPLVLLGEAIIDLWENSIQPTITSIGDGVAPVLDTVIGLWEDLTDVVIETGKTFTDTWIRDIKPTFEEFFEAIDNLSNLFGQLWREVIDPILQELSDGISSLWLETLLPIYQNVVGIIQGLMQIFLALWNNILSPIIDWLVDVFSPLFTGVFNAIGRTVKEVVASILDSFNGILTVLNGLIQFVAGVFQGDWNKAWQGVVQVFQGVWKTLSSVVKSALNAVIGVINTALSGISGAINGVVRAVNRINVKVPDWVPDVGGKSIGFNLSQVSTWKVPYLASGAVVTSPTMAMVGEGKYDEAVIPLDNSPQMKELVNKIAEATRSRNGDEPIQVNVFIGNEQVAEYMHTANRRMQLQTNGGI